MRVALVFLLALAVFLIIKSVESPIIERISPGYVLVPFDGGKVVLLDEKKRLIHRWKAKTRRAYPLGDCGLAYIRKTNLNIINRSSRKVKSYDLKSELHHDFSVLPDGSFIVIRHIHTPNPKTFDDPVWDAIPIIQSDEIVHINSDGSTRYVWRYLDHLPLLGCFATECSELTREFHRAFIERRDKIDWTHSNSISVLPPNRHFDGGDERFAPGNLLVVSRNLLTIFIVEPKSSSVVWYLTSTKLLELFGPHEANMIPKGVSGSGNILFSDNGYNDPSGKYYFGGKYQKPFGIYEIDPANKEIVWSYENSNILNDSAGGPQRLANGNTFFSVDHYDGVFEVTSAGAIVWSHGFNKSISFAKKYPKDICQAHSAGPPSP